MLNHTRRVYKYLTQLITKKQCEQGIKRKFKWTQNKHTLSSLTTGKLNLKFLKPTHSLPNQSFGCNDPKS